MNPVRYENEIRKDAVRLHTHAQQTGEAAAYIRAAELYERCGDYKLAAICREAAERLAK